MTLYKLCDWEINGYSDSDGYLTYYNDETNELGCELTWTTRFAGGDSSGKFSMPTLEIVEKARKLLADKIFGMLRAAEDSDVLEPTAVVVGQRVRLLVDHKNAVKKHEEVPCDRCNGTGKWVNPKNASDLRDCFHCKGSGTLKRNFEKAKDENGKTQWQKFPAGTSGIVEWVGMFGAHYANGYKQPGRFTLQVRLKTNDGVEVKCPLEKLRLDCEPESDVQIRVRAEECSYNYNFKPLFSKHGGWLSSNWAKEVIGKDSAEMINRKMAERLPL